MSSQVKHCYREDKGVTGESAAVFTRKYHRFHNGFDARIRPVSADNSGGQSKEIRLDG